MTNPLNNKKEWIGDENEPLRGFPLEQKDSNPIEFWSDVFLHKNDAGDEIAIIFMISRGLFNNLSQQDDRKTFILPSLISSLQIFNLELISKNDIEFLLVNYFDDIFLMIYKIN